MRQVLSTAFVALVVGALAGGTAGALAQVPEGGGRRSANRHAGGGASTPTRWTASMPSVPVHPGSSGPASSWPRTRRASCHPTSSSPSGATSRTCPRASPTVSTMASPSTTHLADSPPVTIAAADNGTALATCPAGTKVLSGGGTASSFLVHMVTSFQAGNGWIVAYQNTDTVNARTITAIATCATVTPASAIATTAKRARAASLLPDD